MPSRIDEAGHTKAFDSRILVFGSLPALNLLAASDTWFMDGNLYSLVGWLSGGFTPCRHLRPSSGREHTIVTYSVR